LTFENENRFFVRTKACTLTKHPTSLIKAEALRLGFLSCGVSKAVFLEEEAPRLESWLENQQHGSMHYMENHFDKRLDPRLLVDGAQSVVTVLLNYFPDVSQNPDSYKISKYAYGVDYHLVIKDKLKELLHFIQSQYGEVNGRAFVDSAPVMDKAWAVKSGLGWMGKNSNVLTKKTGSFYFIGELIVDIAFEPDSAVTDHCGSCTACLDACPTQAIVAPYVVDGSKCISYYTIELKEAMPAGVGKQFDDWMFGCDVCQDVCPWNRFSKPHNEPKFAILPTIQTFSKKDWEEITEDVFAEVFRYSPIKRTKWAGLQRNIQALKIEGDK